MQCCKYKHSKEIEEKLPPHSFSKKGNHIITKNYSGTTLTVIVAKVYPMAWETWVQSQVESYQRLKKRFLVPPCLTLSIMRYKSRVKWSNPGKGVMTFLTSSYSSYRKRSLLNCIRLDAKKILRKNQNSFHSNQCTSLLISLNHRSTFKKFEATLYCKYLQDITKERWSWYYKDITSRKKLLSL